MYNVKLQRIGHIPLYTLNNQVPFFMAQMSFPSPSMFEFPSFQTARNTEALDMQSEHHHVTSLIGSKEEKRLTFKSRKISKVEALGYPPIPTKNLIKFLGFSQKIYKNIMLQPLLLGRSRLPVITVTQHFFGRPT